MKLSLPTVLISLILHGVLIALLWVYAKPATLPEPPKVMQAILMTAPTGASRPAPPAAVAPEPAKAAPPEPEKPKPVPPKPQPKPELPKPAPEKPKPVKPEPPKKPVAEPQKPVVNKPVPTKPEVVKPKPLPVEDDELIAVEKESKRIADEQAAARKQREAELRQKAAAEALKAEADAIAADAANERARRMSAQIGEFQLAINRKIKANWRRPAAVSGKLVTELRITLLPGGEVASVVVVKSSGSEAFDESAKDAVSRANPLPVPADPALFREQFKVLLLKFKPEE